MASVTALVTDDWADAGCDWDFRLAVGWHHAPAVKTECLLVVCQILSMGYLCGHVSGGDLSLSES